VCEEEVVFVDDDEEAKSDPRGRGTSSSPLQLDTRSCLTRANIYWKSQSIDERESHRIYARSHDHHFCIFHKDPRVIFGV